MKADGGFVFPFSQREKAWPLLSRKGRKGRNFTAPRFEERRGFRLTSVSLSDTFDLVIRSFAHKGLERFFRNGSKAGIQAQHAARLRIQLGMLDDAGAPEDMNAPGWRLHPLKGNLAGHWSVTVNGNWRLTFSFEGEDAILVDYQDYH
jgi:proteic killer suppression protein